MFDSGVGGLTVVRELFRQLPDELVLYVGDTARVPYGPRGSDTITRFALEMVQFLLDQEVKALVVACNSISATALGAIRALSPVPVVDVIEPTVRAAIAATKSGTIGVIGTVATVSSGVYERLARGLDPSVGVETQACPLFVPIAEEGLADHPVARLMADEYAGRFRTSRADVLILGCTHYPLLKRTLAQSVGTQTHLLDSAEPTVRQVAHLLRCRNALRPGPSPVGAHPAQRHRFCVTDASHKFLQIANAMLGRDISDWVEEVSVELPFGEGPPACLTPPPGRAAAAPALAS